MAVKVVVHLQNIGRTLASAGLWMGRTTRTVYCWQAVRRPVSNKEGGERLVWSTLTCRKSDRNCCYRERPYLGHLLLGSGDHKGAMPGHWYLTSCNSRERRVYVLSVSRLAVYFASKKVSSGSESICREYLHEDEYSLRDYSIEYGVDQFSSRLSAIGTLVIESEC